MLEVKNVRKSYHTAGFTQVALDGVSVTFRDNEFAAILGPSGSGKTTLLNIVGGLDKYDSGDLVIDGITTSAYSDRDWDTYRNNRIGFVFQSYNLIPHQTVLANVELALTLSGVSVEERRVRALAALNRVGLADHVRKRPNQLSGGQMQRVAIARALINDPEILLADEPTGALDTVTSTAVMELLTEIARDRLVIMVTHNNELASEYATRIINLKDGHVISDSDPVTSVSVREGRAARTAAMSFLTALSLSFSNLMTKKGRTFVTALAGSIGIIGIAAILALANGINNYIRTVEEETLSIYPLTIQSSGLDLSAMIGGPGGDSSDGSGVLFDDVPPGYVGERRVVETMFANRNNNDLGALKEFFEADGGGISRYVNAIEYQYDITPQIFLPTASGPVDQVNPDNILASFGLGGSGGFGALFGGMPGFGMNVFFEMPSNREIFANQYEVVEGRWPAAFDEIVVVLSHRGRISDYELYVMGLRDRSELRTMLDIFINGAEDTLDNDAARPNVSHADIMDVSFRLVNPTDLYQYDSTFSVWVDRSGDEAFMRSVVDAATPLKIVGIVQPAPGVTATTLSPGLNYTPELITHLMASAAASPLVQEQLAQPYVNVFTGNTFASEQAGDGVEFDFAQVISVDEDLLADALHIDTSALNIDPTRLNFRVPDLASLAGNAFNIDPNSFVLPPFQLGDMAELTDELGSIMQIQPGAIGTIMLGVLQDFIEYELSLGDGEFLDPIGLPDRFTEYLNRPEVQAYIAAQIALVFNPGQMQADMAAALQRYIQAAMQAYMVEAMTAIQNQLQYQMRIAGTNLATEIAREMQRSMTDLSTQINREMERSLSAVNDQFQALDAETLTEAFQLQLTEEELFALMSSMMANTAPTLERNLQLLGYADPLVPSQISIFPRDFEAKAQVTAILDQYNADMEASGQPERVVRYTDLIGALMSSVTDIIGMVTNALIAFVAISLVVSSIMIGVITYISVLERRKEIGILRAIGASKLNIKQVFNAETLIVGFVAGVLGVLVTLLLSAIANVIIWHRFEIRNIAQLPWQAALALVGISCALTFIAGLFPSSHAAKQDPVIALRSE